MPMSKTGGFHLVRCPKCLNILPEPRGVSVYQCGGCNATLRAKIRSGDTQDAFVSATPNSKRVPPSRSWSRAPALTTDIRTTICQGPGTTSRSETSRALEKRGMFSRGRGDTWLLATKVHISDEASIVASSHVSAMKCPKCYRILPVPSASPLFQCGNCSTILNAKNHSKDTQNASVSAPPPSSGSVLPSPHGSQSSHMASGDVVTTSAPSPIPDVRSTRRQGAGRTSRRETDKALKYRGRYARDIASASISASNPVPDIHVSNNFGSKSQYQSSVPKGIALQRLKNITNNFSDERILGQGGFGVVYKGVLKNGEMIAVKKFVSSLRPGLQKQFENEVYHLMMLNHPNIVRFIGYCYETRNECLDYNGKYVFAESAEKLLCLEYLPNRSLDKHLSDESSGLDWSTRYNIIEGICYGLHYLHEEIDKPIIHLDLKPPNILLDNDMVPKITDFGLSRLLDQQQTLCTSSLNGTLGYMAPEFLHGGTITPKSDIFSLGIIILEVVTGHKDYPDGTRTPSDDFIELTLEKWRNVQQSSQDYGSLETDCKQIKRCLQVGLLCVNPDRTKRPPIANVISMLQGSESIDCDFSVVFQQMSI